jgi:hypothetical protein
MCDTLSSIGKLAEAERALCTFTGITCIRSVPEVVATAIVGEDDNVLVPWLRQ